MTLTDHLATLEAPHRPSARQFSRFIKSLSDCT
jgi:hypothetical protein